MDADASDAISYAEFEVPFYKRAQITVSDLATAFGGTGPGRFEDRERLTIFADNLVPHVLRCEGVLVYEPLLLRRIEAERPIPDGSAEEVEIRALALHAVERLVAQLRSRGVATSAEQLDHWLWNRGQEPSFKARPRHRTSSASSSKRSTRTATWRPRSARSPHATSSTPGSPR